MTSLRPRERRLRSVALLLTCTAPALLSLLSIAAIASITACATSRDPASSEGDAGENTVPPPDGGEPLDAAGESDAPVPCAVGNLCRVSTPLTVGHVMAIRGRSKGDVWASGSRGLLLHWNGQQWSPLEAGFKETLSSIFLTADEAWGIGGTLVMRRGLDSNSVRTFKVRAGARALSGVAVLSNGDPYVSWSAQIFSQTTARSLAKIASFDEQTVEYLPDPVLAGTDQPQELGVRALFLVPDKALWLVGDRAAVARFPLSPTASVGPGVVIPVDSQASLLAAWGEGEHLWAAGSGGTILHFDGAAWHTEKSGTTSTLRAIFGISSKDIWAAGDQATVVHFDGESWSPVSVGHYDGNLRAIWGSAADDVWLGGEGGMFHWGALR